MAETQKQKLDIGELREPDFNPYLKTEKLRGQKETSSDSEDSPCTLRTNLANLATAPKNELKRIADGVIDRVGALEGDVSHMIVEKDPSYNYGNQLVFRDRMRGYSMDHQRNGLDFFIKQNKVLVDACGGVEVVKNAVNAAENDIFRNLVIRKFDENPLVCCKAAFQLGNNIINQDWIWTSKSSKALKYRKMYRLKFISHAVATWECYTQYEGDKKKQAEEKQQLFNYWKVHMETDEMNNLDLPVMWDMPTRPQRHFENRNAIGDVEDDVTETREPVIAESDDEDSTLKESKPSPSTTASTMSGEVTRTPSITEFDEQESVLQEPELSDTFTASALSDASNLAATVVSPPKKIRRLTMPPIQPVGERSYLSNPIEHPAKRKHREGSTSSTPSVAPSFSTSSMTSNTQPSVVGRAYRPPTVQAMAPPPTMRPNTFDGYGNYGAQYYEAASGRAGYHSFRGGYGRDGWFQQNGGYAGLPGGYGGMRRGYTGNAWRQDIRGGFGQNHGGGYGGCGGSYGASDYVTPGQGGHAWVPDGVSYRAEPVAQRGDRQYRRDRGAYGYELGYGHQVHEGGLDHGRSYGAGFDVQHGGYEHLGGYRNFYAPSALARGDRFDQDDDSETSDEDVLPPKKKIRSENAQRG